MGIFIFVIVLSAALGFSFAAHVLNVVVAIAALMLIGLLALLLFRIRPKFVAVPIGSLAIFFWFLLALGLGGVRLFEGNSAVMVALDDGYYCQESVYGFVTSDSGEELEVYKRYLFVDYRLYHKIHSDVYPNGETPVPKDLADTVAHCQEKVNEVRSKTSLRP